MDRQTGEIIIYRGGNSNFNIDGKEFRYRNVEEKGRVLFSTDDFYENNGKMPRRSLLFLYKKGGIYPINNILFKTEASMKRYLK